MSISKEAISRLVRDVRDVLKHPLHDSGIYYKHHETDMLRGYALIIGPEDTPYYGGYYFFEFIYPVEYPHLPPNVLFSTHSSNMRFNPNLYQNGKVCLSILNTWFGDSWSSCDTIRSVLLQLCLVFTPNPLLNEPGVTGLHRDCLGYCRSIEYLNIDVAILDVVRKRSDTYLPFFDLFYDVVREHFDKNRPYLVDLIRSKGNIKELVRIQMYRMNVWIDYPDLLIKIENI
jgi:ubiquitin-protein ligase